MIMFILQLILLTLLSLCLGYLPGRFVRNLNIAKQLKSNDVEYRKLKQEANRVQGSLNDCASRYEKLSNTANTIIDPAAETSSVDDLKRIYGIGKKLEGVLNDLGIYRFSQIAELSPEKEQWIDSHLRFKGRIERDQWIDQAKKLVAEK